MKHTLLLVFVVAVALFAQTKADFSRRFEFPSIYSTYDLEKFTDTSKTIQVPPHFLGLKNILNVADGIEVTVTVSSTAIFKQIPSYNATTKIVDLEFDRYQEGLVFMHLKYEYPVGNQIDLALKVHTCKLNTKGPYGVDRKYVCYKNINNFPTPFTQYAVHDRPNQGEFQPGDYYNTATQNQLNCGCELINIEDEGFSATPRLRLVGEICSVDEDCQSDTCTANVCETQVD